MVISYFYNILSMITWIVGPKIGTGIMYMFYENLNKK